MMREPDNKILWQYGFSFIGLLCLLGVLVTWGVTRETPLLGMLFFLGVGCCVAAFVYWKFGRQIDDVLGAIRGGSAALASQGAQRTQHKPQQSKSKGHGKARHLRVVVDPDEQLARRQQARLFYRSLIKHPAPDGLVGPGKQTQERMAFQAVGAAEPEALGLLHKWVRIKFSSDEVMLAFIYIDGDAGLTARGDVISSFPKDAELARVRKTPTRTIQLEPLYAWELEMLSNATRDTYRLPRLPEWYDERTSDGDPSRFFLQDPLLRPMFSPVFPGDVQVVIHDGGPRRSEVPPEAVWVRVTGRPWPLYTGIVRNVPKGVQSVSSGELIMFAIRPAQGLPFLYTDEYFQERDDWYIAPCAECGLDELFDPPSQLLATIAPHADPKRAAFATSCPMCGGLQEVCRKEVLH